MIRIAWVLALLAGCTIQRDVLFEQVTTCGEAFTGENGQACAFDGTCTQPSPSDAMCCTDTAYCLATGLVVSHDCNPDCSPCADDSQCKHGAAICNGTVCEPCPLSPCMACPAGWVYLSRNGCTTCDCAPPSTCNTGPSTCPAAVSMCYTGADCATGCTPGTPGCCSDQCGIPGCAGPIPVGCIATCTQAQTSSGCTTCATDHCTCTLGAWHCTTICANGHHASCAAPP
jgi:hypothetical protein